MATLPKLPKCPKCGHEPMFDYGYDFISNDEFSLDGYLFIMMCHCTKFKHFVPLESQKRVTKFNMACVRTKWAMIRRWKEYVKENSDADTAGDMDSPQEV